MTTASNSVELAGKRLGIIIATMSSGVEKAKDSLMKSITATPDDVFPPSLRDSLIEIIQSTSNDKAAQIETTAKQHFPTIVIPKPVQKSTITTPAPAPKIVQPSAGFEKAESKADSKSSDHGIFIKKI